MRVMGVIAKRASGPLAAVFLLSALIQAPACAGLVSTGDVLGVARAGEQSRLLALLERADVQMQLIAMGVEPTEARARVAALTDEELRRLAGGMDRLPAGGGVLPVGVIFLVLTILMMVDWMGYEAGDIFGSQEQKSEK